jgi:hypothetical protein
MAAKPAFISIPSIGRASLSAANTATDGTGTITDLVVGVAAGTRILEIVVQGTGITVAGLVNLFLWNGTNWGLFDQLTIAGVSGSVTVRSHRVTVAYQNLVIPDSASKLGCAITVAQTSPVNVLAFGGSIA